MENNAHALNPAEAVSDSDTQSPTWIYPVNAVLLGAMTATFALGDDGLVPLLAAGAAFIGLSLRGARSTSRALLPAVACVPAAFVVTQVTEQTWPIVVLAVAAAALYLAGGAAHRRSTVATR